MGDHPTTIPGLLCGAAEAEGGVAHAVAGGAELTYADWHRLSDRFARGLLLLGVGAGAHVVLDFDRAHALDLAVAYVGCQRAGAVPVVLLPGLDDRSVLRAVVGTGAVAALGPPREALRRRCHRWSFDDVLVPGSMSAALPDVRPGDRAQVVYTAGTSGAPRAVAATHENLSWPLLHGAPAARSTVLHALPFGSDAGQSLLLAPLSRTAPATIVTAPGPDPDRLVGLIGPGVDAVVLTPALASELVAPGRAGVVRDGVRSVTVTGDRCHPRVAGGLRRMFPLAEVTVTYGTTESRPAGLAAVHDPRRPAAVGRPAPGQVRLLADAGGAAGAGEVGRIQLRVTSSVRTGLDGAPLSVPGADWIETGDLGLMDEQGHLSVLGRAVDAVEVEGERVPPGAVEDVILDHPDVAQVAVVGIANSLKVDEPWAAVVPRGDLDCRELLDHVSAALGPARAPKVLRLVDDLPRNALGKVLRADLRRTLPSSGGLAVTRLGGIAVHFLPQFDGGGQSFGQSFVPYVRRRFGRVPRLLEWCCGPGFIGFSLLGHGLCEHLGLADVHPGVIDLCRTTIERNGLASRAAALVSDCFDAVPREPRWDLVVANPPHWLTHAELRRREEAGAGRADEVERAERSPLIYLDPMWHTHRKFFGQVREHLADGGSAVLLEHSDGSSVEDFEDMIRAAGLAVVEVEPAEDGSPFYFLRVRRASP